MGEMQSQFGSGVPGRVQLGQLFDVFLHCLILADFAQLLPGVPFELLHHFQHAWSLCFVFSFCGLLEEGVELELVLVGNFGFSCLG